MAPEQSSAALAAQQVQAIVAAAEASAREIEEKARADAQAIRDQAERDAAEHVSRARQMVELLSAGAEQLQGEIDDVVVRVDGLKAAIDAVRVDLVAAEVPEVAADADPDPEPEAPAPASSSGTTAPEGLRLIALNMALSGQPREEADRYLAENFGLTDRAGLLNEVYASIG